MELENDDDHDVADNSSRGQDVYLFIYWLESFRKIDFPKENKWCNSENARQLAKSPTVGIGCSGIGIGNCIGHYITFYLLPLYVIFDILV